MLLYVNDWLYLCKSIVIVWLKCLFANYSTPICTDIGLAANTTHQYNKINSYRDMYNLVDSHVNCFAFFDVILVCVRTNAALAIYINRLRIDMSFKRDVVLASRAKNCHVFWRKHMHSM